MPLVHGNTFYCNDVNIGSVWIGTTSAIVISGPRTGLILMNIGSSDVTVGFGATTKNDVGIKFTMGTIYEMPEYFLYAGSISAIAKTGSALLSYTEGI